MTEDDKKVEVIPTPSTNTTQPKPQTRVEKEEKKEEKKEVKVENKIQTKSLENRTKLDPIYVDDLDLRKIQLDETSPLYSEVKSFEELNL